MLVVSSKSHFDLAHRFAAYLPETLVQRAIGGSAPVPGETTRRKATTIFADVTGFTAMSETLAMYGRAGIGELKDILQLVFNPVIEVIHESGGYIAHFYGDAILVTFYDDDDLDNQQRAINCALKIEEISRRFRNVTAILPEDYQDFKLSMKIGVGYGDCVTTVVGSAESGMEYIVAGPAVDEAVAASAESAETGRVALSQSLSAYRSVSLDVSSPTVSAPRGIRLRESDSEGSRWKITTAEQSENILAMARHFIPATVHRRVAAAIEPSVVEHRPVANIFVQFDGICYDDPQYGELMQRYFLWAQSVIARYCPRSGRVNRILSGDKGNQLHIIIGAPEPLYEAARAMHCALALQNEMPSYITSQRIGITIGSALACPVGSRRRKEYTVIGDAVNLAARLTELCDDGQILTNDESAAEIRHEIKFRQRPRRKLRGKATLVSVCEPIEARRVDAFVTV